MERTRIKEAIVVEGRYDSNILRQIVDAPILETSGFGIFRNKEQMDLIRSVAKKRGVIVLTDSDGAGFVIRSRLMSAIPSQFLKHAYIPDIYGCEKRKRSPGKEGKIGVEGMSKETILHSLLSAGATVIGSENHTSEVECITKQDMFELHLSGWPDSSALRSRIKRYFGLPELLSTNAMLQALNLITSKEELYQVVTSMEVGNG